MTRRRALTILLPLTKVAAILACFGFIALTTWRNLEQLRSAELRLRLLPLIASFPLGVAYLLGRGLIWHLIVRRMIGRFSLRADLLSWMTSLLGKYLPGKVFLLFGRLYFYRGSAATAGQISLCFLVEACCSTLATLLIFGLAAAWQHSPRLGPLRLVLAGLAVTLLAVTHPVVLRTLLNATLRLARRPPVALHLRWRDALGWTALMSLNWLVLGAGFYLLLRAMIDIHPSLYLYLTGAFAVAGVVGVLVLFAPSGIGVREGVLMLMLSAVLPAGVAAIAAIVTRVWITLAEALCAGIALVAARAVGAGLPPPEPAAGSGNPPGRER